MVIYKDKYYRDKRDIWINIPEFIEFDGYYFRDHYAIMFSEINHKIKKWKIYDSNKLNK